VAHPERRVGPWGAAGLGLVCGALALATADLVAALVAPAASPVLAVGAAFIDRTPGWLKDAAVTWFGTNDKAVLLAGMAVVLAALSAGAGVVATRSVGAVATGAAALATVAALAALTRPGSGPLSVVPTVVGVMLGVLALLRLVRGRRTSPRRLVTDPATSGTRREMLVGAAAVAGLATLSAAGGRAAAARGSSSTQVVLPAAENPLAAPPVAAQLALPGLTPLVTSAPDFYRIDTALSVPAIDVTNWRLRVHGMVQREFEVDLHDLLSGPLVERWLTLACVSNEVGGTLAGNARWLGYPLATLLQRAMPAVDADMVLSTSADGWTCSTPLEALTDGRDALLAVGMNGNPLPPEHGFPARMVVPGLYGYVSATKWVVDLEVTRFDRATAYWTSRGYAAQAPIRTFSRIDVPKPFARVAAGPTQVAGVAWAQHRGIEQVQVRVDGGFWHDARLADALSKDTWRQWVWPWLATPGRHTLEVAATDGQGQTQPESRRPPRPDGATGWHSVVVQVT
jgi:DMSO/TMAO reductase YedYZ molybdopterin-dependent catalytic subunit